MKQCTRCKETKSLEDFSSHTSYCKPCNSLRKQEYYTKNADAIRARARAYVAADRERHRAKTNEWRKKKKADDPEHFLWKSAKRRAANNGLPFTLKKEDVVIPEVCPVLGIKLSTQTKRGFISNAATLDKVVQELGYTKENTRVISWRANQIKRDATLEELEAVVAYVRRETEEK